MEIELVECERAAQPILDRLLQLYQYDFSEIEGGVVNDAGRYDYAHVDEYWTEPGCHPFLVKVGAELAGFVLVKEASYLGQAATRVIDEFFVMRKYRRRGVGREVARRVFDRLRGRWEMRETPHNVAAQAFWRTVVGEYTGGRFEEIVKDGRPIQAFDNSLR